MTSSRLNQALFYQLRSFGWSSLYVYGISLCVIVAVRLLFAFSGNGGNFTAAIGGVGFFHFLIIGIAGIRADLRFFIQHGMSRRTTFLSNLYGSLICGIALGLFCMLFNLIAGHWLRLIHTDSAFTIPGFFTDWAGYTFSFFFAWQIGALISLIYYRLGKTQQIVFTAAVFAFTMLGGLGAILRFIGLAGGFENMIHWIVENPESLTTMGIWFCLPIGILAAAGNSLLLRRVQIK